jgi:hypothetical protein
VDAVGGWELPTLAFLDGLPRDPDALLARLRVDTAGRGGSTDGVVLGRVTYLLRSGTAPADLRAALYSVLDRVPGVTVTVDDTAGDAATRVVFSYEDTVSGSRHELQVDRATGDMVEERVIATRATDGVPAGTVTRQTVLSRVVVDSVPTDFGPDLEIRHCAVPPGGGVLCT